MQVNELKLRINVTSFITIEALCFLMYWTKLKISTFLVFIMRKAWTISAMNTPVRLTPELQQYKHNTDYIEL